MSKCCNSKSMASREPSAGGGEDSPCRKGPVGGLTSDWRADDYLGAIRVRLGIRRDRYRVEPGLYTVGNPDSESPVLVTANYKLTVDTLRRELADIDAWILVLDTDGVNVWCAAGKGTFGTEELVRRIKATGLAEVVSHRRLVLPQLGAPGVAAHTVAKESGFRVVYGPVRAADVPAFLAAGMEATAEMRRVRFTLWDRVVVIPVEIALWVKYAVGLAVVMLVARGLASQSWRDLPVGRTLGLMALAFLGGTVGVPVLLPWLPGRAFAAKGAGFAVILAALSVKWGWVPGASPHTVLDTLAWIGIMVAVVSFTGMNFTGASTYTSQTGVKREMRIAMPLQLLLLLAGFVMWVAAPMAWRTTGP